MIGRIVHHPVCGASPFGSAIEFSAQAFAHPTTGEKFLVCEYRGTKSNLVGKGIATRDMLDVQVGEMRDTVDEFGTFTTVWRPRRQTTEVSKVIGPDAADDREDESGRTFAAVDVSSLLERIRGDQTN